MKAQALIVAEPSEGAVRFVALDRQHAGIEPELSRAFASLLHSSAFTLGTEA